MRSNASIRGQSSNFRFWTFDFISSCCTRILSHEMISWRNRGFRAYQVYHRSLFLWNQGQIVWRSLFFHCWFLWLVWLWWWRHHLTISRKKRKSSAESVVTMYVLYYANRSTFTWRQNYKRRCPNYIRIKKVRKIEKNNFSKNQKNKFRKKTKFFKSKKNEYCYNDHVRIGNSGVRRAHKIRPIRGLPWLLHAPNRHQYAIDQSANWEIHIKTKKKTENVPASNLQ